VSTSLLELPSECSVVVRTVLRAVLVPVCASVVRLVARCLVTVVPVDESWVRLVTSSVSLPSDSVRLVGAVVRVVLLPERVVTEVRSASDAVAVGRDVLDRDLVASGVRDRDVVGPDVLGRDVPGSDVLEARVDVASPLLREPVRVGRPGPALVDVGSATSGAVVAPVRSSADEPVERGPVDVAVDEPDEPVAAVPR
jgi:hypothetical protein